MKLPHQESVPQSIKDNDKKTDAACRMIAEAIIATAKTADQVRNKPFDPEGAFMSIVVYNLTRGQDEIIRCVNFHVADLLDIKIKDLLGVIKDEEPK